MSNLAKLAGFALIFFIAFKAFQSLDDTAKAMTGCYKIMQGAQPQKVGCTQTQCKCPLDQPPCASPACGGENNVNYVWQKYTALQVAANLPAMIANPLIGGVSSGLEGILQSLKPILIYGGIFLIVLAVIYVAFKFITRPKEEGKQIEYQPAPADYAPPPIQYAPRPIQYAPPPIQYAPPPIQYAPPPSYAPPPIQYATRPSYAPEYGAPPAYTPNFRMCNLRYRYK